MIRPQKSKELFRLSILLRVLTVTASRAEPR
jgi:hypothetical protein